MKRWLSVFHAALIAAVAAEAAVPPRFSFDYDGRRIESSSSVKADDRLEVRLKSTAYPDFDAVEWVLEWRNADVKRAGFWG